MTRLQQGIHGSAEPGERHVALDLALGVDTEGKARLAAAPEELHQIVGELEFRDARLSRADLDIGLVDLALIDLECNPPLQVCDRGQGQHQHRRLVGPLIAGRGDEQGLVGVILHPDPMVDAAIGHRRRRIPLRLGRHAADHRPGFENGIRRHGRIRACRGHAQRHQREHRRQAKPESQPGVSLSETQGRHGIPSCTKHHQHHPFSLARRPSGAQSVEPQAELQVSARHRHNRHGGACRPCPGLLAES